MKIIEQLKTEFPNNWAEPVCGTELNLKLPSNVTPATTFQSRHQVALGVDPETEVSRIVRKLFETSPNVKVFHVSFSPSLETFTEGKIAGTIVISGVF